MSDVLFYQEVPIHLVLPASVLEHDWHEALSVKKEEKVKQKKKMPSIFTTKKAWIQSTDVPCYNCHMVYHNIPLPMPYPVYYKDPDGCPLFQVAGYYCSIPCLIEQTANLTNVNDKVLVEGLIKLILTELFNIEFNHFIQLDSYRGYSFRKRQSYNGNLSDESFRKKTNEITKRIARESGAENILDSILLT